jgi:crotonobetainyl-CoA:carnitine CoA-transferase CaiB-like acyl-CoA transferase
MLKNIKILDLSRVLAGPLCSMLLADLGADVIKVERPGSGDDTRGWGPPFDERGESAYYLSVNRNKLSVAGDLDRPEDVALVHRLMADADVVLENYRPGALARRGLDVTAMLAEHPRLVWCTITGFGLESARPGYDFVVQAESGWMAITGEPDGDPMKVGVALVDVVTGKDAAIAILAALFERERTGAGRHVAVSLHASAVASLMNVAQNALVSGAQPTRWGNGHPNLVPYQLFHAVDQPVVIAVGNDAQWRACAGALGLDALATDAELATNAGRVTHRDRLVGAVAERVRTRPAAHWEQVLAAVGVPSGVVRPVLDVLRDLPGASALTGMPSSVGGTVRRPPPKLDEHGALIRAHGWAAFA